MIDYYDKRAPEYDATSYELMQREERSRADLSELETLVRNLASRRALDIACGTGWLTRLIPGAVVGLDQSAAMLRIAERRAPTATFLQATIPPLPFADDTFDLCFSSHLYSHLDASERETFVGEALRVGSSLVIVEQAWRPGLARELNERRTLRDGSEHLIPKRYLTANELAEELDATVLLDTPTFVAVSRRR